MTASSLLHRPRAEPGRHSIVKPVIVTGTAGAPSVPPSAVPASVTPVFSWSRPLVTRPDHGVAAGLVGR